MWRAVHRQYVLDTHHVMLLRETCHLLARAAEARAAVVKDGLTLTDRFGGTKIHPLVDTERSSITAASRVLRELGLDVEAGAVTSATERVRLPRAVGYVQ